MFVELVKKMKIGLDAKEIEALRVAKTVLASVLEECDNNGLDTDEVEDMLGSGFGELYNCEIDIEDAIDSIINASN